MSEMVKREKARRVWRLNKKEGVPVLDALETADISKDVYYRIKDKYEEEWEEEILTVEQIQKQLSELSENLETLENRSRQVQDRLDQVRSDAHGVEEAARAARGLDALEWRLEEVEEEVDEIASRKNYRRRGKATAKMLDQRLQQLEQLEIGERLEAVEDKARSAERRADVALERAKKAEQKADEKKGLF